LQEAGLTKSEIRQLSRELGLKTWNKDALRVCRPDFLMENPLIFKKLQMVDEAENFLADLGFTNIRARHEKNTLRIEITPSQIQRFADDSLRLAIVSRMKELGYHYVSIDLEGYRQGSLNESVKAIKPNWQSLNRFNINTVQPPTSFFFSSITLCRLFSYQVYDLEQYI